MMENDYLRDRFYRGGSMDALKKDLDTRFFSKLSLLDEFWSKPIQLGDIGAIILGGKPYIDALMEKGYTKEQAFMRACNLINENYNEKYSEQLNKTTKIKSEIMRNNRYDLWLKLRFV